MAISKKARRAIVRDYPGKSPAELAAEHRVRSTDVESVLRAEGLLRSRASKVFQVTIAVAVVVAVFGAVAFWSSRENGSRALDHIAGDLNVLIVTIDTLRSDRLGSYGYPRARTPVLDALAESGARFERAYALQPVTLPSHTTLMTGTHPAHHGIEDNGIFQVPLQATTLAEMLSDVGLSTGAVVSSFVLNRQFGLDQGFETYDDSLDVDRKQNGAVVDEMTATVVSDRAIHWIAQHPDERWFLWAHYYDPHFEYRPPRAHQQRGAHPYDGEVAYVDFELGRILEDLDARGLTQRTLVIVTSDHGESLGEHGELTHGLFLYESVMRIPLIVSLPGTIPGGRVVSETGSLMDITPTVLEALGIALPDSIQGRSLVPLLFSDCDDWEDAPVILETRVPWHSYGWSPSTAIVHEGFKFIDSPKPELYDLVGDPKELESRVDEALDREATLATQLARLRDDYAQGPLDGATSEMMDDATRDRLASLGYVFSTADSSTAPPADAPDVKDRVEVLQQVAHASSLNESGKEDEAIRILESVIAANPDSRRVLNRLGIWYARRKDIGNAERHFKHLLEVDPDFLEGYENLGLLYANAGRLEEAAQLAEAALSKSPRSAKAHGLLGIVRLYEENYLGAVEPLSRAIEYYPTYHEALSNRGLAYFYLENYEAAVADLALATQLMPDNANYARLANQARRALAAQ